MANVWSALKVEFHDPGQDIADLTASAFGRELTLGEGRTAGDFF